MAKAKIKKTRQKIKNIFTSLVTNDRELNGHFDVIDGRYIHGWATEKGSNKTVNLSVYVNNKKIKTFKSDNYRDDLFKAGINNGYASFSEPLDFQEIVQAHGYDCSISVKSEFGYYELKNSPKKIHNPDIAFSIDIFADGICAGWIVDRNNQGVMLTLEVSINNKVYPVQANLLRNDLSSIGITNCNHGFYINAFEHSDNDECNVSVKLNYDRDYLIAPLTNFCSFSSKVKCLTDLQSFLRESQYSSISNSTHKLVHSIIPAFIDQCRVTNDVPTMMMGNIDNGKIKKSNSIAIIIPVYKGIQETIDCINSVIHAKNNTTYRLIVINDCSPELDMENALSEFDGHENVEIYKNDKNLGFVGTVNRGMMIAEEHDVILLNSDTIVPDNWLDAIVQEAYETDKSEVIGTVTPISNNATICSFPEFCTDNALPKNYDVHKLAAFCSTNIMPAQELPTAHGYCMFIKRAVLADVGYFDQRKWGKGYAEENDFSLRASKLGWKHIVTNKTFIHHLGSVSFASSAGEFIARNLDKLNSIYPDYPELVANFVRKNPVRSLRNELALKIIKSDVCDYKNKPILFISLVIGGGTKVATDELELLLNKEQYPVLMLTCRDNKIWRLSLEQVGVFADFAIESEFDDLISFLSDIGVWHVHYHHTLQFSELVWDIPSRLNCQYDVTLHDFYSVCPRANMVSFNQKFCGDTTSTDCTHCLTHLGVHEASKLKLEDTGGSIDSWRLFHKSRLSKARKVITPSRDAMQRIKSHLCLKNISYKYHPEAVISSTVMSKNKESINIGFLGAIGPHKGFDVIKELAQYIYAHNIDMKLTIIGYTCDDNYLKQYDFVTITGKYDRRNLPAIFNDCNIDIVFISSIWPETYSYTFSEVISCNLPIVAFNLGAIVERSEKMSSVLLLPLNMEAGAIIDNIKNHLARPIEETRTIGSKYSSIILDYYEIVV